MQHTPHRWNKPIFGSKQQSAISDTSPTLDKKGKRLIQSIVGKFLYYGRAIETPSLVALNDIGTQQSAPTQNAMDQATWLMDFLSWHPNGKVRFLQEICN